jgi:small-conductance mechanosensitive channel
MGRHGSRRAWVLAGALLGPLMAGAQTPDGSALRFASKDEYLACLEAADEIQARQSAMAQRDARLKALIVKLQADQAELNAQVGKRTPTTAAEVAAYNRLVSAHRAQALTLNQELRAIQTDQTIANKRVVDTNARCGGLAVSPEVADEVAAIRAKSARAK